MLTLVVLFACASSTLGSRSLRHESGQHRGWDRHHHHHGHHLDNRKHLRSSSNPFDDVLDSAAIAAAQADQEMLNGPKVDDTTALDTARTRVRALGREKAELADELQKAEVLDERVLDATRADGVLAAQGPKNIKSEEKLQEVVTMTEKLRKELQTSQKQLHVTEKLDKRVLAEVVGRVVALDKEKAKLKLELHEASNRNTNQESNRPDEGEKLKESESVADKLRKELQTTQSALHTSQALGKEVLETTRLRVLSLAKENAELRTNLTHAAEDKSAEDAKLEIALTEKDTSSKQSSKVQEATREVEKLKATLALKEQELKLARSVKHDDLSSLSTRSAELREEKTKEADLKQEMKAKSDALDMITAAVTTLQAKLGSKQKELADMNTELSAEQDAFRIAKGLWRSKEEAEKAELQKADQVKMVMLGDTATEVQHQLEAKVNAAASMVSSMQADLEAEQKALVKTTQQLKSNTNGGFALKQTLKAQKGLLDRVTQELQEMRLSLKEKEHELDLAHAAMESEKKSQTEAADKIASDLKAKEEEVFLMRKSLRVSQDAAHNRSMELNAKATSETELGIKLRNSLVTLRNETSGLQELQARLLVKEHDLAVSQGQFLAQQKATLETNNALISKTHSETELRASLKKSVTTLASATSELQQVKTTLHEREQNLSDARDEFHTEQEALTKFGDQLRREKQTEAVLQKALTASNDGLAARSAQTAVLQQTLQDRMQQLHDVNQGLSTMSSKLVDATRRFNTSQRGLLEARNELLSADLLKSQLAGGLSTAADTIRQLHASFSTKDQEMKMLQKRMLAEEDAFNGRDKTSRASMKELTTALNKEMLVLNNASGMLTKLHNSLKANEHALDIAHGQLKLERSKLKGSNTVLDNKAKIENELRTAVREQMAALGSVSSEVEQLHESLTAKETELKLMHDDIFADKSALNKSTVALEAKTKEEAELQSALKTQIEALASARAVLRKADEQLKAKDTVEAELQKDLNGTRDLLSKLHSASHVAKLRDERFGSAASKVALAGRMEAAAGLDDDMKSILEHASSSSAREDDVVSLEGPIWEHFKHRHASLPREHRRHRMVNNEVHLLAHELKAERTREARLRFMNKRLLSKMRKMERTRKIRLREY